MRIDHITFFALTAVALASPSNGLAADVISINDGWKFSQGSDTASVYVHLPHSWNSDAYETKNYFRGVGRYTRTLTVPASLVGRKIYLKFDGAASKSNVSIDGKKVGGHIGAYSPHTLDVTDFAVPGQPHLLAVEVDNSDPDIPPYSADFTFMGGLYRDAWILSQPPVHLDVTEGPHSGFKTVTHINPDGTGEAEISAVIVNGSDKKSSPRLTVALTGPDGNILAEKQASVALKPGEGKKVSVNLNDIRNISLWTPETPALYTVTATLADGDKALEKTSDYTAFRTFGFDDEGRFLLNGKPYKLRGMCRHQDQKPMGIALSDEQHRRDIRMIKDMGANFIRISHYPQDNAVLEMCDRLGLIAWEEIPVIDYVPESDAFADNCETMLRQMIRSHFNHPSIAMWGYMNEILLRVPREGQDETGERTRRLARRLEKVLKEEDPGRLSTMAFHGNDAYHDAGLSDITDVKGWNLYQGWYGGQLPQFEEYLSRQHREHPSHKLIVSEYGAGSDLRLHSLSPEPFDFSMEYQQDYLEHYLPVIEDSTFIAGASHWNFIDFSSANRAESMPHINNKGIVTNDRRKKDVYYYYRATWKDADTDTVAHIAVRDWPERTEIIGKEGYVSRPVKVYTNLPEVVLKVNGTALPPEAVKNSKALFSVPLRGGINFIELASADNPGVTLDAASIDVTPILFSDGHLDLADCELAVNVGSGCYFRSDDSGLTWLPDCGYTPGKPYGHIGGERSVSQDEILLTDDQPLLQRCLTGLEEYRVAVKPGRYEVELSFAELSAPSALSAYMLGHNAGTREGAVTKMDIEINGKNVETDFAPSSLSGTKSMVKRRYSTDVNDNNGIIVKFKPSDNATTSLSAIKIRKI